MTFCDLARILLSSALGACRCQLDARRKEPNSQNLREEVNMATGLPARSGVFRILDHTLIGISPRRIHAACNFRDGARIRLRSRQPSLLQSLFHDCLLDCLSNLFPKRPLLFAEMFPPLRGLWCPISCQRVPSVFPLSHLLFQELANLV